ncbi:tryptophan halogenase family protein [Paraglaciecola sp. 25GB23A]|uniref:tryptophan halogenase family protein n=1 Tax=Paraglaciecola sp. 25GB23A TaxID=3156068 RepID=UPI0032AF1567
MLKIPDSILIVGGGTAGWMAANLLLHRWPSTKITLIESADIGTVGVGEGATPYLKQYFRQLNIAESEWMPACDATYKVGISFENWSTVAGYEQYFHPFFSVLDKPPAELFFHNCGLRRRGWRAPALPNDYFVNAELARRRLSPVSDKQDIDYAYHFDANKLGHFLRDKAKQQGLLHIVDNVAEVIVNQQGKISAVQSDKTGLLKAELYIDCSGFSGLLIHKALKQAYVSYADNLFNDAAVAIQTPLNLVQPHSPQTHSIALSNGWMWQIPLTTRTGNGYVYSRGFISPDQAETELRQALQISENADVKVKHLTMRIGRLESHWAKNCLALGLSQGFIEPLEATALMLTQLSIEQFIQCHEGQSDNEIKQQADFNREINRVFDGVRDYIVAHYKLNSRIDSDYWRENAANKNVPASLANIVDAWDKGLDVEQVLNQEKQQLVYLRPSWYCILAGMGRFPTQLQSTKKAAPVTQATEYCQKVATQYFTQ